MPDLGVMRMKGSCEGSRVPCSKEGTCQYLGPEDALRYIFTTESGRTLDRCLIQGTSADRSHWRDGQHLQGTVVGYSSRRSLT